MGYPDRRVEFCGRAAVASRTRSCAHEARHDGPSVQTGGDTDLLSVLVAAAALAVLVPRQVAQPEKALQSAVAGALAARADDRLLEAALAQYPSAPAIVITYGHLDLFGEQLGPQVVPIVAAYQDSLTTADAFQIAGQALQSVGRQLAGDWRVVALTPLTPEERGLVALLKMRDEGNAFVGQWEITEAASQADPQPRGYLGRARAADRRPHGAGARHRPGKGDRLADLRPCCGRCRGDRGGRRSATLCRDAARAASATTRAPPRALGRAGHGAGAGRWRREIRGADRPSR